MNLLVTKQKNRGQQDAVELSSLKVLFGIYAFFIIASIVMPQYFGIHIGFDITCARMANLMFVAYVLLNRKICTHFFQTMLRCEILVPACMYLFVAGYTMVFRVDINAFFLVFLELFSLFMMIYGIRYVVGVKRAIRWIIGCAYFLSVYGLVEYVYGKSLFLQFFKTVPTTVVNQYRSGHYRIMGPCGHPLGYGMVLLLLIAIVCVDLEKNEVFLFKRPVLLVLLYLNVFLTGSRSTLGIAVLEMLLIFIMSNHQNKLKTLFYAIIAGIAAGVFLLLFWNTEIGQYILGQIASVIDQVFDTNFAANFGVDVTTLSNSESYREALPYIFTLDWLNPLVGRGLKGFGGAEINGVFVQSIDNYYVQQYIKYAYPGLVSYVLFILVTVIAMIRAMLKHKSAVFRMVFVGVVLYYVNLWWVDALQTLKFVYIFIALFYAQYLEVEDKKKREAACREGKRCVIQKAESQSSVL